MEKLKQIQEMLAASEADAAKFYDKSNYAAGKRLRKSMQELKVLSQEIRREVSKLRNK